VSPEAQSDLTETLLIECWELVNATLNDDSLRHLVEEPALAGIIDGAMRIGLATGLRHGVVEGQ
jgi:hypothetical protein